MNGQMNRRAAVKIASSLLGIPLLSSSGIAQEATPAPHEHSVSPSRAAPLISVMLTDTELSFPSEIAAGINRVEFHNEASVGAHVLTMRLPDGVERGAFLALIADEAADMPEYLRDQYFPGVPDLAQPGETVTGWIRYEAGTYCAINLEAAQAPAFFTVAGSPWGVSPPHADHEVGMVEMTFVGLDTPVASGDQVWSLINYGATWHEIMVIRMPEMMTPDDLLAFFMTTESGDDLENAGYSQIAGSGIMSPGTQSWLDLTLEPGAHAALCFAPNDFSGPPHAVMGMISTFVVE